MRPAALWFAFQLSITPLLANDDWQRVICVDDPSIGVTMLVRRIASPADETFIGFEINNRTAASLKIVNVNFRLDNVTVFSATDNQPIYSTSIAGGNIYDLLWREGNAPKTNGPRDNAVPPGVCRFLRYWSIYTMAVLKMPDKPLLVSGRIHFEISLLEKNVQKNLSTPLAGVPFRFVWQPPEETQLPAMRQRLAHTLATATDPFGDAYLLGLFLSDKRLTSTLTLDELLKGLEVRKQGERSVILEYIDQHYPTDQKTIDFCLKAISRRDWLLLSDLSKAHFIRDTRLIGPLLDWVRMDAGHSYATHFALVMLHNHRHLMPDRNGISAELGRIVLPSCRQIDPAKSATNKSLDEWYFWDQEPPRSGSDRRQKPSGRPHSLPRPPRHRRRRSYDCDRQ